MIDYSVRSIWLARIKAALMFAVLRSTQDMCEINLGSPHDQLASTEASSCRSRSYLTILTPGFYLGRRYQGVLGWCFPLRPIGGTQPLPPSRT